jgi:hypothetical protein
MIIGFAICINIKILDTYNILAKFDFQKGSKTIFAIESWSMEDK